MSNLRSDSSGWGIAHIYAEGYRADTMFCGALFGGLQHTRGYCHRHGERMRSKGVSPPG